MPGWLATPSIFGIAVPNIEGVATDFGSLFVCIQSNKDFLIRPLIRHSHLTGAFWT